MQYLDPKLAKSEWIENGNTVTDMQLDILLAFAQNGIRTSSWELIHRHRLWVRLRKKYTGIQKPILFNLHYYVYAKTSCFILKFFILDDTPGISFQSTHIKQRVMIIQ